MSKENTMTDNTMENSEEKIVTKKVTKKDRRFYGIPFPVIYLMILRLSCPFCINPGRPKIFKNLWKLRMHFTAVHTDDRFMQECKNLIGELVDYIRLQQSLTERWVLR